MALEIEQLQIKIESDASGASSAIDKLTATLGRLKSATSGASGLTKIATQLSKLSVSVSKFSNLGGATANIQKLQTAINGFSSMGKSNNIGSYANQIKKLNESVSLLNSMPALQTGKITTIVNGLKEFESLDKSALKNINGLSKIPKIVEYLSKADMTKFAASIMKTAQAVKPLADEMQKISEGFNVLPVKLQRIVNNFDKTSASTKKFSASFGGLRISLNGVLVKMSALYIGATRIGSVFSSWLTESNSYTENLNLFTVAMRDTADEALQYANTVNSSLGIDTSEFIRNQGIFEMITTGFGLAKEKADVMSKTLTQLGYDISSAFNIDITSSMEKIQSGISGELEPLRRLGYALDQATLQQIAYKNGINMAYNKMTQAQKSQLRYLAILEQSKNVMGDMARTILTPANSLRILDQQFTQLKRALGNMLIPMLIKVLPYIQAFVRVLTDAANAVAKTFGFELPTIDYSSLSDGATSVSKSTDKVADSAKKAKKELNGLAGFDKLDVLAQNTDTSGAGKTASDPFKNIDMPTYDFLGPLDKSTDEIYNKMKAKLKDIYDKFKDNKDLIISIGKLLAGLWAVGKVAKFIRYISGLKDAFLGLSVAKTATGFLKNWSKNGLDVARNSLTKTQKALGVFAGTLMGGIASFDFFKNLEKGTMTAGIAITDLIGIGGGLAIAFATGGPVGLAIAGLGVVVGGLVGHTKAITDNWKKVENSAFDKGFFDEKGRTIDKFTDSFKDLNDVLQKSYDKIAENQNKINSNNDSISDAITSINTYKTILGGSGKLTASEIGEMKTAIDNLNTALKDNVKLETDNIFTAWSNDAKDAAKSLGYDVGKMTTILNDFKNEFGKTTDTATKSVNDYLSKKASGKKVTATETKKYNQNLDYVSGLASIDVSMPQTKFNNALTDASKLNFEDIDTFKSKVKDLKTYADKLFKSQDSSLLTVQNNIDKLKAKNQYMFDMGKISSKQFNVNKKAFDDYYISVKKGFDTQKEKIKSQLSTFVSDTQSQYKDAIDNAVSKNLRYKSVDEVKKYYIDTYGQEFWDSHKTEISQNFEQMKKDLTADAESRYKEFFDTTSEFANAYNLNLNSSNIINQFNTIVKDVSATASKSGSSIGGAFVSGMKESINQIPFKDLFSQWIGQNPINIVANATNGKIDTTKTAFSDALLGHTNKVTFKTLATGGMPATGEMFVANENGPELVGRIGNKTAVANTSQITDNLYKAIYAATRDAQENNNNTTTHKLIVEADDSALAKALHPKLEDISRTKGRKAAK